MYIQGYLERSAREELQCQRERGNSSDLYAVAVLKDRTIVGHLPRKMTKRLDMRY